MDYRARVWARGGAKLCNANNKRPARKTGTRITASPAGSRHNAYLADGRARVHQLLLLFGGGGLGDDVQRILQGRVGRRLACLAWRGVELAEGVALLDDVRGRLALPLDGLG